MYTVGDHAAMMGDVARMRGYMHALEQAVRPGAVVVDLGSGTGILTLLACRLGADCVHAIEPSNAINVARNMVAANGYADRVEFHDAMSTDVSLPQRADVIIIDLAGMLPWYQRNIPSIIDARDRFLASTGVLIPARDAAWAAMIDAPALYEAQTRPWDRLAFGFDLHDMRDLLTNTWVRARLWPEDLLTGCVRFLTIDYREVEDANVRARISWTLERSGTAHFIAIGMDSMVGSAAWFSNAPDAPVDRRFTLVCPPVLLPLPEPTAVARGDAITVDLSGNLVGGDYVWAWRTSVHDAHGAVIAAFSQSTFLGAPISLDEVKTFGADATPIATDRSHIALLALTEINRGAALGDIATRILTAYPTRFARFDDALTFVATLTRQFC